MATMKARCDALVAAGRATNVTAEMGEDVSHIRFLLCGDDEDGDWYERETQRSGTEYSFPAPDDAAKAEAEARNDAIPSWNILISPGGSTATLYPDGCETPEGGPKEVRRFLDLIEAGGWEDV